MEFCSMKVEDISDRDERERLGILGCFPKSVKGSLFSVITHP
jgi:hypothetical protein